MSNVTRTIYAAALQTSLFMGTPLDYPEYSTLNRALGIRQNQPPAPEQRPELKCFVWGNRGHRNADGQSGIALTEEVLHMATDAGLYGMLPFVLRETNNDLTAAERAKFALRRQEEHSGVPYFAYYGRRMDKSNLRVSTEHIQVEEGKEVITTFVPTAANLSPTPRTVNPTGVNHLTADYVSARSRMNLRIEQQLVAEMLNVAKVIYDDERYAIASEIGLVTGVDLAIQVPTGTGAQVNFLELIGAQIAAHVPTIYHLAMVSEGVDIEMDVGVKEPLFALSPTDGKSNMLTA